MRRSRPWLYGLITGAGIGLVLRPIVVVVFWLAGNGIAEHLLLPTIATSCLLGLVIGLIAGVLAGLIPVPLVGSFVGGAVGALLAFLSSYVTTFLLCVVTWDGRGAIPQWGNFTLYWIFMTLTGIVPGVVAGIVADVIRLRHDRDRDRYDENDDYRYDDDASGQWR